ncbi:MAG: hypothetical protein D6683_04080 [Actinomyces sp.]|nr:MAG: hypothetical protein D6683_04080 [Actinomyces sp.]
MSDTKNTATPRLVRRPTRNEPDERIIVEVVTDPDTDPPATTPIVVDVANVPVSALMRFMRAVGRNELEAVAHLLDDLLGEEQMRLVEEAATSFADIRLVANRLLDVLLSVR